MTGFGGLGVPSLLLLASVAALVVAAYARSPRSERRTVSSLLLWQRVAAARNVRPGRRRWWFSLMLALMASVCIAFALGRSGALPGSVEGPLLFIVLDASPSMRARVPGGQTRWAQAKRMARDLVGAADSDARFVVADTSARGSNRGPLGATEAFAAIEELAPSSAGRLAMPPLPDAGTSPRRAVFISDGVSGIDPGDTTERRSVFHRADNAAVISLRVAVTPDDARRALATAVVRNASPGTRRVEFELRGPSGSLRRTLTLESGQTIADTTDVSSLGVGALQAAVHLAGDAFEEDDTKAASVPDLRARRVLLVTRSNGALDAALHALPGLSVTSIRPSAFVGTEGFDACVFDDFDPPGRPELPSIFFHRMASGRERVAQAPRVTRVSATHPLGAVIPWRELHFRRAVLTDSSADVESEAPVVFAVPAARDQEGALLRTTVVPHRRIVAGFTLEDSDIAARPDVIVFLAAALDWLMAERPVPSGLPGIAASARSARDHRSGEPGRASHHASASGGDQEREDRAETVDINASTWPEAERTVIDTGNASPVDPPLELCSAALWAALLILAFERVAFVRGWTV